MMKKILAVLLSLAMVCSFSACSSDWDAEEVVSSFDAFAESLGQTQITGDNNLIGERKYADDDHYTGEYTAECDNADGRDVIFGGASVKERKLKLTVKIAAETGNAVIRIRLGAEVEEYTADENGNFEKELDFNGGGNYIMIDYENFKGKVNLLSEYLLAV